MTASERSVDVEFQRSLALSLVIDLSLIAMADEYEGFDQWIYSTHAALSNDLRSSIRPLFKTFANELLFDELVELVLRQDTAPPIEDLPALIRWVSELDESTIHDSHVGLLRHIVRSQGGDDEVDASIFADRPRLSELLDATLAAKLKTSEIERLVGLLMNPEELQAELTLLIVRFWDRHYRIEHARCRPIEERSIEYHRDRDVPVDPLEAFVAITGRSVPPGLDKRITRAKKLIFVPSCHGGPYASVGTAHAPSDVLVVVYNCLPTGSSDRRQGPSTGEIFPPLKALADETRLAILDLLVGRELYAQQIVDQMEISQSAVSRHLRLMVACGVLRERKQEGMKFYSIDGAAIARLCESLDTFADHPGPGDD